MADMLRDPVFHGPVLLSPGDAVSTTRIIRDHAGNPARFEPATFVGHVLAYPRPVIGGYAVLLDTGETTFRTTQTLAIWYAS